MTVKQQKIIDIASKLFSKRGYKATSTKLIAEEAGVSEGLIFRHFENKEKLLKVILNNGEKEFENSIISIQALTHPKVILKQIISLPFNINSRQEEYWIIFFNFRLEKKIKQNSFIEMLYIMANNAFKALNYSDPKLEAETFMMIWEGSLMYLLLNEPSNSFIIYENLLSKYDL